MNVRYKVKELERKARGMFEGNFIGLSEACAVLGKTLKESELANFCSFSVDEDSLKRHAKEGFCLIPFIRMSIKELCSIAPKLFSINLTNLETYAFKKEMMKPGWYLVRKQPRYLSFGGIQMQESGMTFERNPRLAEVMYAFSLCYLVGKRQMLIEQICILCRDEVMRRGEKMHICFKTNQDIGKDKGIKIEAWRSHMPLPNIFPIKKA